MNKVKAARLLPALVRRAPFTLSKSDGPVVVLPPAAPGSLGDEAILRGIQVGLAADRCRRPVFLSFWRGSKWPEGLPVTEYLGARGVLGVMRASAAVVAGADVLDGYYGVGVLRRASHVLSLADAAGAATRVVGMSFNEDPTPDALAEWVGIPARTLVYARDSRSRRRAEVALRRPVHQGADPAFLLGAEEARFTAPLTRFVQSARGLGAPLIGLSANRLLARQGVDVDTWRRLIVTLLDEVRGAHLILITHDVRSGGADTAYMHEIVDGLPPEAGERLRFMPDRHTAAEVKGLCRQLDLVVTARMHLAIASFGVGTPAIGLGYQDKFEGVFEDLGVGSLVLDGVRFTAGEVATAAFDAVGNGNAIRRTVLERLPAVRERARASIVGRGG